MKVIGKAGRSVYICEVQHDEIAKFLDLYYKRVGGNYKDMDELQVGQVVDLGRGHDWAAAIERTFRQTKEFLEASKPTIEAIFNGLSVVVASNTKESDKT